MDHCFLATYAQGCPRQQGLPGVSTHLKRGPVSHVTSYRPFTPDATELSFLLTDISFALSLVPCSTVYILSSC